MGLGGASGIVTSMSMHVGLVSSCSLTVNAQSLSLQHRSHESASGSAQSISAYAQTIISEQPSSCNGMGLQQQLVVDVTGVGRAWA